LNHPYRRPVIGWADEIAALQTDQVLDFYRRWYGPNNAVVVVSGDVGANEVRAMAERTYGLVKRADIPTRPDLQEPPQRADRRLTLEDPRVGQPSWTRSWRAPSYRSGAVEHAYPLQVLEEILGGGATSRLYRMLVVERPVAVSAGAWYDPSRRGPTELNVFASPRPGVTMEELEAAVVGVLRGITEGGVTDSEVEQAKRRLSADAVYARDLYSTASRLLGEMIAIGQSAEDVEAWPERIAAVTRPQVDAAARAVLAGAQVTTLLLGTGERAVEGTVGAAEPSGAAAVR
jgi:zinc protease